MPCARLGPLRSAVARKGLHSRLAGDTYFRAFLKKPPADPRFVRGRLQEKDPVAELLSEHCFAGKCSTSHVLDPGDA